MVYTISICNHLELEGYFSGMYMDAKKFHFFDLFERFSSTFIILLKPRLGDRKDSTTEVLREDVY
jgi:hypothetical protein